MNLNSFQFVTEIILSHPSLDGLLLGLSKFSEVQDLTSIELIFAFSGLVINLTL